MEIRPVAWADQTVPSSNIRTRVFFVVYATMNQDRLRDSLDQLIRHHWRILGGRLKPNPRSNRLEYHTPATFPDEHQLFKWSSHSYNSKVQVPLSTAPEQGITFHDSAADLTKPFVPKNWPLERKHEKPDAPLLWIHISKFTDATVLSINIPHVVSDQLGLGIIVKAWIGLLKGQKPPKLLGYNEDQHIPANEGELARTQRVGQLRLMSRWEKFRRILGFVKQLLLDPGQVVHSVFIPHSLVRDLKRRCIEDTDTAGDDEVSLSSGDIVAAILIKFSQMGRTSPHPLHFYPAINLRGRIPEIPNTDTFIHNAVTFGGVRFPASQTTPLAEFARQHRRAIIQALRLGSIRTWQAVLREYARRKEFVMLCEPGDISFHVTSWSAAWRGVDFSSAAVSAVDKPVVMLVLGQSRETSTEVHRFDSQIMCRTDEGYWCNFAASTRTMRLVKRYLESSPTLEDTVLPQDGSSAVMLGACVIALFVVLLSFILYKAV